MHQRFLNPKPQHARHVTAGASSSSERVGWSVARKVRRVAARISPTSVETVDGGGDLVLAPGGGGRPRLVLPQRAAQHPRDRRGQRLAPLRRGPGPLALAAAPAATEGEGRSAPSIFEWWARQEGSRLAYMHCNSARARQDIRGGGIEFRLTLSTNATSGIQCPPFPFASSSSSSAAAAAAALAATLIEHCTEQTSSESRQYTRPPSPASAASHRPPEQEIWAALRPRCRNAPRRARPREVGVQGIEEAKSRAS
nr:unnamed protein product [Digitaria exilis]